MRELPRERTLLFAESAIEVSIKINFGNFFFKVVLLNLSSYFSCARNDGPPKEANNNKKNNTRTFT